VLSDAIANDMTIKLFAGEDHERSLLKRASGKLMRLRTKSWSIDEVIGGIQAFLMVIVEVALMYAAVILWQEGLLTTGDFALIQAYVIASVQRLWNLSSTLRAIYTAFADATEMLAILDTPHAIADKAGGKALVSGEGRIEFKSVGFRFHGEHDVLTNLSFAIAGKEKVALVGPSGAGKTTITKLMVRFHDVTDGEISIDGQNIMDVTQESLRNSIAFVPQEPVLFHRTLMDNIRYGRRDATDDEVIQAAKDAHCYDFIQRAPDGFST
jgi:ATP-binding cassette, subfamily B, bacterial